MSGDVPGIILSIARVVVPYFVHISSSPFLWTKQSPYARWLASQQHHGLDDIKEADPSGYNEKDAMPTHHLLSLGHDRLRSLFSYRCSDTSLPNLLASQRSQEAASDFTARVPFPTDVAIDIVFTPNVTQGMADKPRPLCKTRSHVLGGATISK